MNERQRDFAPTPPLFLFLQFSILLLVPLAHAFLPRPFLPNKKKTENYQFIFFAKLDNLAFFIKILSVQNIIRFVLCEYLINRLETWGW